MKKKLCFIFFQLAKLSNLNVCVSEIKVRDMYQCKAWASTCGSEKMYSAICDSTVV